MVGELNCHHRTGLEFKVSWDSSNLIPVISCRVTGSQCNAARCQRLDVLCQKHAIDLHVPILRNLKAVIGLRDFAHGQPCASGFEVHEYGGGGQAVHDRDRAESVRQGESDIVGVVDTQVAATEDELRPTGKGNACICV